MEHIAFGSGASCMSLYVCVCLFPLWGRRASAHYILWNVLLFLLWCTSILLSNSSMFVCVSGNPNILRECNQWRHYDAIAICCVMTTQTILMNLTHVNWYENVCISKKKNKHFIKSIWKSFILSAILNGSQKVMEINVVQHSNGSLKSIRYINNDKNECFWFWHQYIYGDHC